MGLPPKKFIPIPIAAFALSAAYAVFTFRQSDSVFDVLFWATVGGVVLTFVIALIIDAVFY